VFVVVVEVKKVAVWREDAAQNGRILQNGWIFDLGACWDSTPTFLHMPRGASSLRHGSHFRFFFQKLAFSSFQTSNAVAIVAFIIRSVSV
jgi:hypothetical protein